jgi:hypothetical protein
VQDVDAAVLAYGAPDDVLTASVDARSASTASGVRSQVSTVRPSASPSRPPQPSRNRRSRAGGTSRARCPSRHPSRPRPVESVQRAWKSTRNDSGSRSGQPRFRRYLPVGELHRSEPLHEPGESSTGHFELRDERSGAEVPLAAERVVEPRPRRTARSRCRGSALRGGCGRGERRSRPDWRHP